MSTSLRIDIETDPEDMEVYALLDRELNALAAAAGLEPLPAAGVVLAVVEAVNNVVKHAYGLARGRPLHLRGRCGDGVLQIMLRDRGAPMPLPLPDGSQTDLLGPGGRGWPIIRAAFPVVRYERVDGENRLTLIRPLAEPAAA
jgi:serine/threonine-protein kinase RsbW